MFSRPSSAASNHELTSSKYPDQDLGRSKQQQEILHGGEAPQDYSQLSTGVGKMQQRKTVIRKSLNDAADQSHQNYWRDSDDQLYSKNLNQTNGSTWKKNDIENQYVPAEFIADRQT